MAYKWILNGREIRYLSEPKPIHNQSNTKHKIISKQYQYHPNTDPKIIRIGELGR